VSQIPLVVGLTASTTAKPFRQVVELEQRAARLGSNANQWEAEGQRIRIGCRPPGTLQARNTGIENAASNSFRVYAIRVQLRPKSGVLAVNFGEEPVKPTASTGFMERSVVESRKRHQMQT
jgi:hypothetical protein